MISLLRRRIHAEQQKKAMGTSERISRAAYVLFAFVSRIHTNILFFQLGYVNFVLDFEPHFILTNV